MDQIYMIGADGLRYGPYDLATLQSFVTERRVVPLTKLIAPDGRTIYANAVLNFSSVNSGSYGSAYGNSYNSYGNTPLIGNDSGSGPSAVLPRECQGLNWGAFFLPFWWSIFNQTYLGLLCLIPCLNFIMSIVLLIKGNEWAWQNRRFVSPADFNECQKIWMKWGLGIFIAGVILSVLWLIFVWCIAVSSQSIQYY
ncbi:MAG: hypothetical protein KBT47_03305 [Armatimonadetes bacterium]|nr:hypothetical protein [Candidatus Hippobium faecium]